MADTVPLSPQPLARRAVLLGASNLVRGMPTVLDAAVLTCGGPAEVFWACGHGRSYGMKSTVMGRTLPGIAQCGLWQALADRPPLPTTALVTDIGNDLLYGASPEQIAGWVEACVDRLLEMQARVVITALPLMNIDRLSEARYKLFRTLLFPKCRLSFDQVRRSATELDERVRRLASARSLPLVAPRGTWYGLDPIHIRYRHAPAAWHEVLSAWSDEKTPQCGPMSWRAWLTLHRLKPAERWMWGRHQCAAQPARVCDDGTTLWLY